MPQKKKGKLSRTQIASIVATGVLIVAAVSLIITNVFIPVQYLAAYINFSKNANTYGHMRVSFIDVGNSDSTIVELPDGKILLIDGGDGTYSHNLKILKELNTRNVNKIDYLICSSVENSACGGLAEIMKYKSVDRVFAPCCPISYITNGYKTFCERLEIDGCTVEISEYGAGVFNEEVGYFFCFLSPDVHSAEGGEYDALVKNPASENIKDASAVIWLEYDGVTFVFTGGTSSTVQEKILNSLDFGVIEIAGRTIDLTSCNVIKLSDHGSAEGAYAQFTDFLSPQEAIISVGVNGMGYPTLAALANAQNCVGSNIYRTDECGTVIFTVTDGTYAIEKEKK